MLTLKSKERPPCIAVFTGSRAEYGLLQATIARLSCHSELSLALYVAGSHLSPHYGMTVREIEADGFPITARFPSPYVGQDTALDVAETIRLLSQFWADTRQRPDALLLLGDRHETFAAATAATLAYVPLLHIHGGDVTAGGLVDDSLRHSISKMAHLHFPATQASAHRLEQMGEEPWRIHVVGSPAIENALWVERFSREHLAMRLSIKSDKKWILFTQHPVSPQPALAADEMRSSLDALVALSDCEILMTGSNQDAGGRAMAQVLHEYSQRYPNIRFIESAGRVLYLNLVREAWLVAGNSSSGLLDAASFAKPVLNIGSRQTGRERGDNVWDIPQDTLAIREALQQLQVDPEHYQRFAVDRHPFGHGTTSERIIEVLLKTDFSSPRLLSKPWTACHQIPQEV